ncbi:MAG TPA: hypothetical protein VIK40_02345 [Geomonas sp.]
MVRRVFLVAITAVLLGACSTYHDTSRERLATMTQRYSQFDLVMAWETSVVGENTLVEGAVKNVRWAFMYDLEIWVSVLDPGGKVVARSVSFVIPLQLNMDQSAEFSLKLPIPVEPGTKLRFTYKYRGSDGGDHSGFGLDSALPWMQSFDAVVPPGN